MNKKRNKKQGFDLVFLRAKEVELDERKFKIKKMKKNKSKYVRPNWDEYFLMIAEMARMRGTCDRGRTACVIVRDKRLLSTGYVGSPIGAPHCDDVGHEMHTVVQEDGTSSRHCIRTSHAEQNAIAQAARLGAALEGATIYCLMAPCYVCAKMIINTGIKRVVAKTDYHGSEKSRKIFKKAGVKFELLDKKIQKYVDMK